jgi:peptidoglycan/LPS O-acetylase OafA/YrhL
LRRPFTEAIWYWLYLSNWSWFAYGILPGIGHLWSLAVEEQFYIAWPWAAVRARPTTLGWLSVGIVLGSLATRAALHALRFPDLWLYSATVCRADALAMGALVALALRSKAWRPRLARGLAPVGVASTAALGALLVVTHGMNRDNPLIQVWGYSLLGISCAALVALAARPETPAWQQSSVLRFFGKYSYGIYLAHPPIKHVAHHVYGAELDAMMASRPIATDATFIGAITLAAVGVALVSRFALEEPALRWKDRLAPR